MLLCLQLFASLLSLKRIILDYHLSFLPLSSPRKDKLQVGFAYENLTAAMQMRLYKLWKSAVFLGWTFKKASFEYFDYKMTKAFLRWHFALLSNCFIISENSLILGVQIRSKVYDSDNYFYVYFFVFCSVRIGSISKKVAFCVIWCSFSALYQCKN